MTWRQWLKCWCTSVLTGHFTTLTVDSHDEKRDASREHITGRGGSDGKPAAHSAWRSAFKASRRLVRQKGRQYWHRALVSAKGDTKQTWKHLDTLLGKGDKSHSMPSCFMADDYHQFLDSKVKTIRERTSNAGPTYVSGAF